jgi:hypothetical protein
MKYQLYAKGEFIGTINHTLKVVTVPSGEEADKNCLQYLIDQHPDNLLIVPEGEHKKSKCVSLSDIAPKIVPKRCKKARLIA